MTGERQARMADRIKVLVAERLEKGLRDPRMGFVTITDVRVTGDLQHASVFYTVLGSDEERASTADALRAATGMLRSEVGRKLGVRLTPTLEFIHLDWPKTPGTSRSCFVRRVNGTMPLPVLQHRRRMPAMPTRTWRPASLPTTRTEFPQSSTVLLRTEPDTPEYSERPQWRARSSSPVTSGPWTSVT